MRRPLYVKQMEQVTDGKAVYWWIHKGRNGKTVSVSETFPSRSNAIRAARGFITSIAPVAVEFTFWTGPNPAADPNGTKRRWATENYR